MVHWQHPYHEIPTLACALYSCLSGAMRVGCRPLCVEQYHHAQSRRARRTECLEPRVGVSLSFQAILSGLYLKQAVVPHKVHLLPTDQRLVSEPVPFPTESGADTRLRSITSRAYTVCVYLDFDLTQSVSLSGACARGGDRFRSTRVGPAASARCFHALSTCRRYLAHVTCLRNLEVLL